MDSLPSARGRHEEILQHLGKDADRDEDKAAASSGSFKLLEKNIWTIGRIATYSDFILLFCN